MKTATAVAATLALGAATGLYVAKQDCASKAACWTEKKAEVCGTRKVEAKTEACQWSSEAKAPDGFLTEGEAATPAGAPAPTVKKHCPTLEASHAGSGSSIE